MKASLISTEGPWLEATLRTDYGDLTVMDEFSLDDRISPKVGEEFDVDLSALTDDEETWESIFSGNPECRKGIDHLNGWIYRGYGQIIAIGPVIVDCGFIQVPDVIYTNDSKVIGAYVGFTITRLDAEMANHATTLEKLER